MPNNLLGTGFVRKSSTATVCKSSCLGFWTRLWGVKCIILLVLYQKAKEWLDCYAKATDADCFTCGSGIERQLVPVLDFFPCTGLNLKLSESRQISAPGTVPMHFPVGAAPPFVSRRPVCLRGGLTHSFTAVQPHHLSSSLWQASLSHPTCPFSTFSKTHTHASCLAPHCEVLPVSNAEYFINVFIRWGDNADEGVGFDCCNTPHCLICRSRPLEWQIHREGGWLSKISNHIKSLKPIRKELFMDVFLYILEDLMNVWKEVDSWKQEAILTQPHSFSEGGNVLDVAEPHIVRMKAFKSGY